MNELVNQYRDALTVIATNHSFTERLVAFGLLPLVLQRLLLDTKLMVEDKLSSAPIDKVAQHLLDNATGFIQDMTDRGMVHQMTPGLSELLGE